MFRYSLVIIMLLLCDSIALANSYEFSHSPSDYLLRDRGRSQDSVFDEYRTINLGIDLSSGVDCGRLNLKGTLKSSIDKILDPSLFGNALDGIVAGAPLLTLCYFSPTACSLAKHFRMNAQMMSQIRLDQCSLMDKYVDSRVEDYYAERQDCLHKELQRTGGNHEEAVSRCGGSGIYQKDLANWAGESFGGKVKTNKLIDSSAKWAGLTSPSAKKAVNLVKAFVGDSVVSQGQISVEYGPHKNALSPSKYLRDIKSKTYNELCVGILEKLNESSSAYKVLSQFSNKELEKINSEGKNYIDRQSLYYLALMPPLKRNSYCEKLSASIAMSKFSLDMGRSIHILSELSNNPNLPPHRKRELERKASRFKDSVEVSLQLEQKVNQPINTILAQINMEGRNIESSETEQNLNNETASSRSNDLYNSFFDCADGVYCEQGGH